MPHDGDTVTISSGDSVVLDHSTPQLDEISIDGTLAMSSDTLLLTGNRSAADTLVQVRGTLDIGRAWFLVADTLAQKPIVHVYPNALFRTKVSFPVDTTNMFDSSHSPLFALDAASTFEYYSDDQDIIDLTYLANNLIGGAYQNLTLTNITASFRANPISVLGTLHINFGASINTNARKSSTAGRVTQDITISGDVVNDNQGESGGSGAGLNGCGFQSSNTDRWIFDRSRFGTFDTCHWSGPSQLGTVIVRTGTVLSVRHSSDSVSDSLDIINQLLEEGMPCGGHVIGKVFSEITPIFDASHLIDSFFGLGITITSGTSPFLGRTRVVRTSGYLPTNVRLADNPILRYYSVSSAKGPQGTANEITMQVHCDELNGARKDALHFWRSRDGARTWAYSGISAIDPIRNLFTWDTTTLSAPSDSGTFYWTLSEGYTDIALPVLLENFYAQATGRNVDLVWKMASETGIGGYELDRTFAANTKRVFATALSGAPEMRYSFTDLVSDTGTVHYDLYEISKDGIRSWLASRTVDVRETDDLLPLTVTGSRSGLQLSGWISGPLNVTLSDILGHTILSSSVSLASTASVPVALLPGIYVAHCTWPGRQIDRKFVVFGE